jgi:predicted metal-binding protein
MARKAKTAVRKSELSDAALRRLAAGKPGVKAVKMISASDVATAPWVRLKCQFGCDGYARSLVCPPFTPTPEQMRKVLDAYRRAILIQFERHASVKATIVELERDIFMRGAWKVLGLGAGSCHLCRHCPTQQGKCRHADQARPAIEACGIDVFTTARKAGLPIEVISDTRACPNYYGLVLVD